MVHIVGAGPGAPDLITVRGQKLLETADVVIYAGSLVNPELLAGLKANCRVYNSALMTLEEVLEVIREAEEQGLDTVRLHTGTPAFTGRSGSRWTPWTGWEFPMISVRGSAPSAARLRRSAWSTRFRASPRAW